MWQITLEMEDGQQWKLCNPNHSETALTQARYWGHEETAMVLDEAEVRALAAGGLVGERSGAAECVLLPAEKKMAEAPEQVRVKEGTFVEYKGRWGEVTDMGLDDKVSLR